ncbi:MAG: hypothetical protein HY926_11160, partial [Elusimicrobia bacterium]|nr:hypothetical protein [Elusimicrobiota bacterium]
GSFLHLDPGQRPAAGADEGLPEAAQQAQETPSYAREPMSFMDAQTNFQTVVEAKLARESDSGAWPYLEPGSKRPWLLELRKLDVDTIRELDRDRFSGCVLFARREPLAQVDIDFTVDFSGSRWRVSEVRLHSVAAQKKPAPRKQTRKRP